MMILISVELGKEVVTKIGHNSEDLITVDGYQAPNFYVRQIEYDADLPELTALIERAATCTQGLSYKCRNSRLLISPGSKPGLLRGKNCLTLVMMFNLQVLIREL